jgi:hypothetical protein
MTTMSVRTFLNVSTKLPVETSVLLRGNHGIGKSQVVRQVAKHFGLEVIDRRLSQMSEGDMVGLPSTDGEVTRFNPPDWYKKACKKPVALFLDELNRATPEVMQAAFQVVLDRELNGWKLHPETRIYAAVNASAEYSVNELDPAQADRFWTIDLEPTVEDWLTWATDTGVDSVLVDFIRQNPGHLRAKGQLEPGKVYPSQRSWDKLNQALKKTGLDLQTQGVPDILYPLSIGFVGLEASIAFRDFVKNYENILSAEDILNDWKKNKGKVGKLSADKQNALLDKILIHCKGNTWTDDQLDNVSAFAKSVSQEMTIACPRFQDSFMRRCRYHAVTMTQQLQQRRKPERIAPFQSMGI